jgi:alkanesulfonate monooxygenase SsuD/methylene tetrahydromethanopterin reductase-like flavin-dependent oxidoreductase (luciferase family)
VQDRIPIYLAAIGPRNTALAGEIADGWLPILLAPEHLPELRTTLEEGAARADRSLDGFDIVATVNVMVSDDVERARDAMRPFIALYVGGMGSRKHNFYNQLVGRYGFEEQALEVQGHYLAGDRAAAMAAIPDELIDMVTIAGPPDVLRERLRAYRDAGVGTLSVALMPGLPDEAVTQQLRLVAEAAETL